MTERPTTVRLGALAADDHLGRLYQQDTLTTYTHVDVDGATIQAQWKGRSAILTMSDPALGEFIADMEYQVEFSEGAYRAQCRRALAALREGVAA